MIDKLMSQQQLIRSRSAVISLMAQWYFFFQSFRRYCVGKKIVHLIQCGVSLSLYSSKCPRKTGKCCCWELFSPSLEGEYHKLSSFSLTLFLLVQFRTEKKKTKNGIMPATGRAWPHSGRNMRPEMHSNSFHAAAQMLNV